MDGMLDQDGGRVAAAGQNLAAGSQVASFRIIERVGSGGMAVVYQALDERLGRQVALKILAPALAADQEFRQRFIRESRTAAAVEDPHIIPVYEAGEADGHLFIAMRYVSGGDVLTLVRSAGALSSGRAVAILSAVASALDAAHGAGLVHRDVKPANMLLDASAGRPDHVYLSDFGLSKGALSSVGLTGTGLFLGTPDYIAPEQVDGGTVDGRADQYALACSAFEMLSGAPPFQRDHALAVIYAHQSQPPPRLTSRRPDLSAAADKVLATALAKDPAERFASCQDFTDALRGALRLPADNVEPSSLPKVQPQASRHRLATEPGERWPHGSRGVSEAANGAPGRGLETVPATGQKRPGVRWRHAGIALAAAVMMLGAAGGLLLAHSHPGAAASRPVRASLAFAPRQYRGGLLIVRHWTLGGQHGSLLTETVSASSATGKGLRAVFEDVIPAAIAPTLQTVKFTPAPSKVVQADPVVTWNLLLPPQGSVTVGYRAQVPAAGATRARLLRWARALNRAEATLPSGSRGRPKKRTTRTHGSAKSTSTPISGTHAPSPTQPRAPSPHPSPSHTPAPRPTPKPTPTSSSPLKATAVPIPIGQACMWAYPGQASGSWSGSGYSIVCLDSSGNSLGGFPDGSGHSLNDWCADPSHTDGNPNLIQAKLSANGNWVCTTVQ